MVNESITPKEYEARIQKVRSFLAEQNLGALFVYSPAKVNQWNQTGHVSYLSGWANHGRIVDSAVIVPVEGDPALLFSGYPFMVSEVREVSPITDIRLVGAVDPNAIALTRAGGGSRDLAGETLQILDENGLTDKDIGIVGLQSMPVPLYEALASGFEEKLRHVDDIVAEIRAVKTPEEVALMRHAAQLSDLGFETMLKVSEPGMRGIEIIAEMERAVRRKGADMVKYWMASGPPPKWEDSRMDMKPHERVLEQGDLMASCSYVLYNGYWCHGQRTGTLREPCAELEKIAAIAGKAQDAGLEIMKDGTPISAAARTIRETGEKLGLEMMGSRIGHGIGMDYSEMPVPLTDENDRLWQSGNTAIIHSTFSLPGSGKLFVPLGDVCQITTSAPDLLMEFQRTPFLAGV